MEGTIEYQIIVSIHLPNGATMRSVVRSADRNMAISKHTYLTNLLKGNKVGENREWTHENLGVTGQITNIEGLFGVSYVKIL